jgi:flavin reductase (DIM6/NTAB) family NADH-FMN oxidoreductase RutF
VFKQGWEFIRFRECRVPQSYSFDPALGHGLPHDPIKAIIAPRPIGWISSVDKAGQVNLAPYSFFNLFCSNPPILVFGSEGRKDSIGNIEATGEFVFNLATRSLAEAMNLTSGAYANGTDEFEIAGLEKAASDIVAPPRVAASPASMECRLLEIKPLVDIDGNRLKPDLVIGQVVRVHIDPDYLNDGLFDITRAGTIARCGYRGDYVEASEVFEMIRPAVNAR